ncbi:hypothetical protein [Vibrio vulnificus]|uniref:hypothetical protein n=1 Tax=Vibrio vulnificus TaxID=672 RepID=UPI000CD162A3|nr:hypothetical protein [Vibrio vulnificus]POC14874.1 hypothetical protein CRN39_03695 [Vibrio vulnificus]
MRFSLSKSSSLFLFLFVFLCALDPADYFGFKKISFLMVICFFLLALVLKKIELSRSRVLITIAFISFGCFGLFLYAINIRSSIYDSSHAFGYFMTFFLFIIFCFLNNKSLYAAFVNSYSKVGVFIITFTIGISILFVFFGERFFWLFSYLNYEVSNSFITSRMFGGVNISMVYLKSVVLLFPLVVVYYDGYLKTKSIAYLFLIGLSILSLCLSGTRTNIILALFLLFALLSQVSPVHYRKYFYILAYLSLPIVIIALSAFISYSYDDSSTIKSSLFTYYIRLFINDISYFFIGDGFGSVFFAESKSKYVAGTELVYLDLIKYFGVSAFILFFILLMYPFYMFLRKGRILLTCSYISYLLVSATNPLLISSTGMIALIYFFSEAEMLKYNE